MDDPFAVADLVPLALAVAATPTAVIPAVLVLLGSRPRAAGSGFLVGWMVGVLVLTVVATALAGRIDRAEPAGWVAWVRIVLGVLLLVLAVRQWSKRSESDEPPAWLTALTEASPGTALRTALLLSAANPKVIVLALAAGVSIGSAGLGGPDVVALVVGFTLLASVTVALPLLVHVVAGARAEPPLRRLGDWLEANQAAVLAVVLAVLGVLLVAEGLAGA